MPGVAVDEIIRLRDAVEPGRNLADALPMHLVGVDEGDPGPGAVFGMQPQTDVAGGGESGKRRAIHDQAILAAESARRQRRGVGRGIGSVVVDDQQRRDAGDRLEHRCQKGLVTRAKDEVGGDRG